MPATDWVNYSLISPVLSLTWLAFTDLYVNPIGIWPARSIKDQLRNLNRTQPLSIALGRIDTYKVARYWTGLGNNAMWDIVFPRSCNGIPIIYHFSSVVLNVLLIWHGLGKWDCTYVCLDVDSRQDPISLGVRFVVV